MKSEKIEKIVDLAATLAARADEFDQVLILCQKKKVDGEDDCQFSFDNGLELGQSLWLVEGFKFWLQAGAMGLLSKRNSEDL